MAVVGASTREDSMGEWALRNLERGRFPGKIYPVNPAYEVVRDLPCFASLADLPERPDLVIFTIGDHRLEQTLDEAIALSIPAAVIMSSLVIDDDDMPVLKDRVQKKLRDAGMLVCGANGMGFYNVRDHVLACGFDSTMHEPPGNVTIISHSGSGMCGIIDCDKRVRTNLSVSTGNELSVTMDEYLDFALDLPETKVVGLFVETARNPEGFRAALAKAVDKRIPIVAIKVGKTAKAAELTVSHSGAMAGDDAAYQALFDRYGVHRVADMDEFATALIMFAELNPIGPGGLVTLHDSGGERQLMVDLAAEADVPLTDLTAESVVALEKILDPELPAVNPLDGWSRGGTTASQQMQESLVIMMNDPGTAMGAGILDRAPDGLVYTEYVDRVTIAKARTGKPVALVGSRQGTGEDPRVVETTHAGIPVLDGVPSFLRGVRGLMNYRDFLAHKANDVPNARENVVEKWTARLATGAAFDEYESFAMLQDFEIETSTAGIADSAEELSTLAASFDYPLVLKTAMPGIQHKTEVGGVHVGIKDGEQLLETYTLLAKKLGPRVLLSQMVEAGVDMILGVKRDPQFGPIVILGMGGLLAEVQKDVVFLLPPFDRAYARRQLEKLRLRPLLDGVRGRPPADIDGFCFAAEKFSVMVDGLGAGLCELDINPLIVNERGCVAVDALVVPYKNE